MKCPECNKELRWVGDEVLSEDETENEHLETVLDCSDCNIDVIKRVKLNSKGDFQ